MKSRTIIILLLCLIIGVISCKPKNEEHQHHYEETIISEPTCTEAGTKLLACTCGDTKYEQINPLGHDGTSATCMVGSVCKHCGEIISQPSDHVYSDWVVTKDPTCLITGVRQHTCIYCGKVENEIVSSLEHNYSDWTIIIKPTCTEEGLRTRHCSVSGEDDDEVMEKTAHNYGDWTIISEATCSHEGLKQHECADCHKVENAIITTLSHNYDDWKQIQAATCQTLGIEVRTCQVCHEVENRFSPMTEHSFIEESGDLVCSECGIKENKTEVLQNAINSIQLPTSTKTGLDLPTSYQDVTISWKSLNKDVILDDGTIYAGNQNRTAKLIATFTYENTTSQIIYDIQVPSFIDNSINYCWNIYFSKKLIAFTVGDLYYLWKDYGDCQVLEYRSSDETVINQYGQVFQKDYDQTVTVKTFLKLNKVIQIYETEITVGGWTNAQRVAMVAKWLPDYVAKLQNGEINSLPITHPEYKTKIVWYCLEAGICAGEGVIVKPLIAHNVTIKGTVVSGDQSKNVEYELINFGGNMTIEQQIQEWMKGQLPTSILGTKNVVYENDSLKYQIRINEKAVLNLIDGTNPLIDRSKLIDITSNQWVNRFWGSGTFATSYHPFVSQEILNKMMYEGYQMPNDKNILWITVHESGMPRVNNDAALLAKIQLETANGIRDREASWNYQVDENMIYQSFEDEVICWHAGDGTKTAGNGNNNSIGIEMCINEDGNYDGAMYNDAKLIAYLLHKYNLNLNNVKRHFDWSGKICPNYMITQGRWTEFLNLVDKEYTAMALLKDCEVSYTVTTDTNNNTQEVLNQYFTKGASTLWFAKVQQQDVTLHLTMQVNYKGQIFTTTSDLVLHSGQ